MKCVRNFAISCVVVLLLFGCQSTNNYVAGNLLQSQPELLDDRNSGNGIFLAGTEWASNPSLFYRFIDEKTYNFCLFVPGNVQDKGTYVLNDNIVTFNSITLGKSWTAKIEDDKLIRETGEIYTK
jgi:hypothetical protein